MDVRTTPDAAEFWAEVEEFLLSDPVVNTVLLTVVDQERRGRGTTSEPATYAIVRDGGNVVGAAMRTPPFPVYVSRLPDGAVEPLADAMLSACSDADGVTGTSADAAAFARAWARRTGTEPQVTLRQRIHRLDGLIPPQPVPGRVRVATPGDRDLLLEWTEAFTGEVGDLVPLHGFGRAVDMAIADERAYLWDEDGRAVSYVGCRPGVAGVVRVGPVFTPPAQRGRGYASALVAAVSERKRNDGAALCLYTDLANPTSNKIYAAIGYVPVADVDRYAFRS